MKKSLLIRLVSLLLIASTLSGCIWWVEDDGNGRGGGRGGHHGESHGDHGDHGDHGGHDDHR
jgi:hypothetical protein